MIAKLIPLDGSPPYLIVREVTLVGRKGEDCDLAIESASISKLHCAIARTDGLLFVRDLGSTNGTKVNGQRVTRGALLPGDELTFANIRYKVFLGPGEMTAGPTDRTEAISLADWHDPSDAGQPLPVDLEDDDDQIDVVPLDD